MNMERSSFCLRNSDPTIKISVILILFNCIACGPDDLNYDVNKPEDNRFTKVVLAENLDQPMQMDILKDGRVIFVEREGSVKVFDPNTGVIKILAEIPVSSGYYDEDGTELSPVGEDGMHGVVLDPNYEVNKWIYLYYSPKEEYTGSILARFEWHGDKIDLGSRIVLLQVPNQRKSC